MMITIITTRQEAIDICKAIYQWRKANVRGYSADSWANCELPDADFDALYKHQTDNLWYVPLDNENCLGLDGVESLPEGWRKVEEILP